MNGVLRVLTVLAVAFPAIGPALAQESSLVGSWQTTHAADKTGPAFVATTTYTQNGEFYYEMAIAPGPGGVGTIVRTRGNYELDGPNSMRVVYGNTVLCGSAGGCSQAPPNLAPTPGSSMSVSFQFHGPNQIIGQDGTTYVRVR